MKKITAWKLVGAIIIVIVVAGGLVQLYLKDNLVVSLGEHHEHAHAEESEPGEGTSTASTGAAPDNLVANYSFEVGTDLTIDSWAPIGEDPGTSAWRDSSVSAFGSSSAALSSDSSSRGVNLSWSQTILGLTPGTDIKIKGYVKTEDLNGTAFIRVAGLQQTSQSTNFIVWLNLDTASGTSDWTAVEGSVYLPEEVNVLDLSAGLFGKGRAWFDDISILSSEPSGEELARNVNLLQNPDFSQGLTGWNFFSVAGTPTLGWEVKDACGAHGPSLQITQPQPVEEENFSGFFQTVNNLKRTRDNISLTGWVKTSGLEGSARLNLTFFCLGTRYVFDSTVALSGTQDWQQLEINAQVPENADSVWINLVISGRGTALFDDLDLRLSAPGN